MGGHFHFRRKVFLILSGRDPFTRKRSAGERGSQGSVSGNPTGEGLYGGCHIKSKTITRRKKGLEKYNFPIHKDTQQQGRERDKREKVHLSQALYICSLGRSLKMKVIISGGTFMEGYSNYVNSREDIS